jgi:hypothetical protein
MASDDQHTTDSRSLGYLTNAPLLATKRDAPLFVDREQERHILERNVKRGWNTLVLGQRGVGKTSLLNRAAADLDTHEDQYVAVRPRGQPDEPGDFLTSLAMELVERLERSGNEPTVQATAREAVQKLRAVGLSGFVGGSRSGGTASLVATLDFVTSVVAELRQLGLQAVFVVDDVGDAQMFRALFGRLRDELWSLGATWIVSGSLYEVDFLVEPPTDVFFPERIIVGPLDPAAAVEFVTARVQSVAGLALSDKEARIIARVGAGYPARMLELLRATLDGIDPQRLEERAQHLAVTLASVSSPAQRLAEAVIESGEPGRTTDATLQRELGVTPGRLRQLFHELVEAGAFEVGPNDAGSRGRPSLAYRPRGVIP